MVFNTFSLRLKSLFFIMPFFLFYFIVGQNCAAVSSVLHTFKVAHHTWSSERKLIQINTKSNKKSVLNQLIKTNAKKKKSLMAEDDSGNKELWSNAFNFAKNWGAQVDPRTGTLSAFIKTGAMVSNLGHGPDINLQINYSSNSTANPDRVGMGWSWNLTHFNPVTKELTTSAGKSFYLINDKDRVWKPLYHKLKDILIRGNKQGGFTITYADGLREILNKYGYEERLEQQDGWGVNFIYTPGTHVLNTIEDDMKHKINIGFDSNYLTVTSYGTYGQPVKIHIRNTNAKLSDISLPLTEDGTTANIYISYDNNRIRQIHYPTGLEESFQYNCNDAITFSGNNNTTNSLCAVSMKSVMLNKQQESRSIHRYEYAKANNNEHDYLGFDSGLTGMNRSVRDILFEAPSNYTYQTTEDDSLVKEFRTYDKYHLLIDDKKISDRTGHIISEIQNFYCRSDKLNGCAQTSFKDLPSDYSLPLKIVTKLWGSTSGKPDISTVTRNYDSYGRVVSSSDSYGRVTKTVYCPIRGDTACPAEPGDWPFSGLPEKVTVYPAKIKANVAPLFPVTTYHYYHKEPDHIGHDYTLVSDHQTQCSGTERTITTMDYYNNPISLLAYGLIKRVTITGTVKGALTSVSKDYRYTENSDGYSRITYKSIELDHDQSLPLSTLSTSLFTNQVLQKVDAAGKNITCYHYDLWGRVIQTDLAVGTPFASHIKYQYTLSPNLNEVLITKADGLQQKVIMDSAGRRVMDFDEAVSINGKAEPGQWRPKNKITYDSHGRVIARYSYLNDSSGNRYPLITTYGYDEMGVANKMHLSDGETRIKLSDDSLHCTINYSENAQGQRSPLSVVISNVLDKPVQKITLPVTQTPLASTELLCTNAGTQPGAKISETTYDGFGRAVTVTDPMGRVIRKTYDTLGQVIYITDPAGNKTHFVYNLIGKVIQTWSLPYSGGKYLLSGAQYNAAGELLWHTGEDGKRTTYTYTTDGKIQTITTSAGHTISIQYNELSLPIAKYADGKLLLKIGYDPVTLLPVKKTDNTGVTDLTYSDDHLLQQEIHTGANGYPDYQLQWQYDQNRRVISSTDINGHKTFKKYDALGRVAALYYQNSLLSSTTYDGFSRVIAVHYGSGMKRTISYDSDGHLSQVKDLLNDKPLTKWNYIYDADNNIIQVNQQADEYKTAAIRYQYDNLDNLVSMNCDGSSGLPLCPRETAFSESGLKSAPIITRQDYFFTPLNRIAQVKETLQNAENHQTLSKITTYDYSDIKTPLRLQNISTSWNKELPVTKHFSYDVAGNMRLDGEGNRITYNLFNQITSVIKPDGIHSFYAYDGANKEVMEKTSDSTHHLFYSGGTLINESISILGQAAHTVGYYGIAKTTEGVMNQYYERNYKGDVIAVLTQSSRDHGRYQLSRRNIYSPYGMSWHNPSLYLDSQHGMEPLFGFDGERTDPATGWQFLGAGHRTYNPAQRYFVSEDPVGDGYRFGSNNPIMKTDPTGNMPHWLGKIMGGIRDISSFGLIAFHKKWANITASVILAGLSVAGVAAAVSTYGGSLAVAAATGATAIFSSVPIVATAIPKNKALNIAGAISGGIAGAIAVATGLPLVAKGIANLPNFFINFSGKSLASNLLQLDSGIAIRNALLSRNYYATVDTMEQVNRLTAGLTIGRAPQMFYRYGTNVAAFITASNLAGRDVDLQAIGDYLIRMQELMASAGNEENIATDAAMAARQRLFSYITDNPSVPFNDSATDSTFLARGISRAIIEEQRNRGVISSVLRRNGDTWQVFRFDDPGMGSIDVADVQAHELMITGYTVF